MKTLFTTLTIMVIAALGLAGFALLAQPTISASAAAPQGITVKADCPPIPYVDDQGYTVIMYNWTITVSAQPNSDYNIDISMDGVNWGTNDWSDQNDPIPGGGYTGPLVTQSYPQFEIDNSHVWVRLTDNPSVVIGPVSGLCQPGTSTITWTNTGRYYWTLLQFKVDPMTPGYWTSDGTKTGVCVGYTNDPIHIINTQWQHDTCPTTANPNWNTMANHQFIQQVNNFGVIRYFDPDTGQAGDPYLWGK